MSLGEDKLEQKSKTGSANECGGPDCSGAAKQYLRVTTGQSITTPWKQVFEGSQKLSAGRGECDTRLLDVSVDASVIRGRFQYAIIGESGRYRA